MMLAEATGFDLDARTVALRTAAGDGDARLRHADRRRRLEVQLLRPPGVAGARGRAEVARGRAAHPRADPAGVRGRRGGRDRGRARAPADVRDRRRGPDRGRDGGPDRRDRPRHARATSATSTPRQTRVLLRRGGRSRARRVPAEAVQAGDASRCVSLGVTPMLDHAVTDIDADGVDDRATSAIRAGDGHLGGGRARRGRVGHAGRGVRRRDRPGRAAARRARPLAARPPRGARDRRHGAGARRTTRCPASRRWRCRWGATRPSSSAAGCAARTSARSSTRTRATWRRSAGRARSPSCRPRIRAWGFPAWALWLGIHLFYLVGFQNRLLVLHPLGLQLPHARARDAADHRRAEYAVAVIYWPCDAVRRPHRRQPAADPRSAARARAVGERARRGPGLASPASPSTCGCCARRGWCGCGSTRSGAGTGSTRAPLAEVDALAGAVPPLLGRPARRPRASPRQHAPERSPRRRGRTPRSTAPGG